MNLDRHVLASYLTKLLGEPVSVLQIQTLTGSATGAEAIKAFGYGKPLRIDYSLPDDRQQPEKTNQVVLHQVTRNGFGREREADRVAEVWLNRSDFNRLPKHVRALDLVAVYDDQNLVPAGDLSDLMLLTAYAPGQPYADDLLRIRDTRICQPLDLRRAELLASYLVDIHRRKHDDPLLWRRRLRDLVGHGEGIMGLTDSYPTDFPHANADDLRQIEEAANRWRWQLKPMTARLAQVHGDFHPFNVLFEQGETFHLLDRSRGEWGEPADDVSCMGINYLFFSLQAFGELTGPFEQLYRIFWETYLTHSDDPELLRVIQPWFAWRTLVLASPQWYPTQSDDVRSKLLTFARRVMQVETFDWQRINDYLS